MTARMHHEAYAILPCQFCIPEEHIWILDCNMTRSCYWVPSTLLRLVTSSALVFNECNEWNEGFSLVAWKKRLPEFPYTRFRRPIRQCNHHLQSAPPLAPRPSPPQRLCATEAARATEVRRSEEKLAPRKSLYHLYYYLYLLEQLLFETIKVIMLAFK